MQASKLPADKALHRVSLANFEADVWGPRNLGIRGGLFTYMYHNYMLYHLQYRK